MYWVDEKLQEIKERFQEKIESGDELVIRDEKTSSGQVHVGSMVGVAVHGVLSEALAEAGIKNEYFYEINDTDAMDGLPVYLDQAEYANHMGKRLKDIPAPDGKAKNFAEYFAQEYIEVIRKAGFTPTIYRSSELYESGKMNDLILTALNNPDKIRTIYKEVSNSHKPDDWLPLNVVCETCGKIGTTKVVSFDGKKVKYVCQPDAVEWAKGCGAEGEISPFDGNATLPWKVEWAAKFVVMGVNIETAGKDHYTKGGSRDVSSRIAEEVFGYPDPYGFSYEFFLVGGKKMSSSKGNATSSKAISDLVPPKIFRLALTRNVKRQINFDPEGDTIPRLYDLYDSFAEKYHQGIEDDETRTFHFALTPEERMNIKNVYLPRFSTVSFLVQMKHLNLEEEIEAMKGEALSDLDKEELRERAYYAQYWIDNYAPEAFVYKLQELCPPEAMQLADAQKRALGKVQEYLKQNENIDGQELHYALHEIRKELEIEPKDFFSALYISFLGKNSGPKAGWFLSVLDRHFVISRIDEVLSG